MALWLLAGCVALGGTPARAQTGAPTGTTHRQALTLDEAIRLTRAHHPDARAARSTRDAAVALQGDAGRRPNPVLSAGVENVGGGVLADARESQIVLSQPFELGGDRGARVGLAEARFDAASAEVDLAELEQEALTTELYLDAWTLQESLRQRVAAVALAREAVASAIERLREGAAPAYERTRAETFLTLREIESARGIMMHAAVMDRLVQQWSGAVTFDSLALSDPPLDPPPALDVLEQRTSRHPGRRKAEAVRREGEWRVTYARALRTPDLSVEAGVRRLEGPGATGFVLGLSLPLPLWNTSSGSVTVAESERETAQIGALTTERDLARRLRAARARLMTALQHLDRLRNRAAPAAEEAMVQITNAYRAGRLGYLDIQEGQRALLEIELMRIETLAEVWRARAELDRLTGGAGDTKGTP
jgi:cobalt-zinc-cadmium efflux system outer membrane protein